MSNKGQCEIWIQNLTVGSEQSAEKRYEANHYYPVRHASCGEIEHLGVAKNFSEHVRHARTRLVLSRGIWLARSVDREEFLPVDDEQDECGNGDPVCERGQYQVQPVGHGEEGIGQRNMVVNFPLKFEDLHQAASGSH